MAAEELPLSPRGEANGSMLGALAHRDFRLMWWGLVISNIGTWMRMYGMGWLVVELAIREGSPNLGGFYLGLVGLSRAIPSMALGLVGGVVADRVDRRKLVICTETAAGALIAVLAFLTITEQVTLAWIIAINALTSLTFSFDVPARSAMTPRLVPERDLLSAIGLQSAAFNGATLIGPLLGGAAIVPFGVGGLFVASAVSYSVIIGALVAMRPQPVERLERRHMVAEITEGVRYVRREAILAPMLILMTVIALFGRPYIQLLPAIAHDSLGAGALELSWLLAASGVGSFVGSIATTSMGSISRRGLVVCVGTVLVGVTLVAFALQHALAPALVLIAVVSLVTMLSQGVSTALFQLRTPNELRGRVMSLTSMSFMVGMPLGQMVLGTLGSLVGIDLSIALGGVIVVAVGAALLVFAPALRDLRSEETAIAAPSASDWPEAVSNEPAAVRRASQP